jgi:methyltransferase-like protein
MAWALPEARFVGIDTAASQVAEAKARAAEVGLENVEFRVTDILDFEDAEGSFDYVIAHGVLSWVPREVQDALLRICGRTLSENGVAFISYNTQPGWHVRGGIRDLLLFHTEVPAEPEAQIHEARAVLDLYAELSGDGPFGLLLQREAKQVRELTDWYLYHDHLADLNHPFYFREFMDRAREVGLQYLADAEPGFPRPRPEAKQRLYALSEDRIRALQYEDFLLNRAFRCSLLVQATRRPAPEPDADRIKDLWVSCLARPEDGSQADLSSHELVAYSTPEKKRFQVGAPIAKAALQILFERWPAATPFQALYREARQRLGRTDEGTAEERDLITSSFLEGFRNGFLYLIVRPGRFVAETSQRPVANPLARLQAVADEPWVTNGMHSQVKLSAFSRRLLAHLDGRDRAAVLDALEEDHWSGRLVLRSEDGESVEAPEVVRKALEVALDHHLSILTRFAMLVS